VQITDVKFVHNGQSAPVPLAVDYSNPSPVGPAFGSDDLEDAEFIQSDSAEAREVRSGRAINALADFGHFGRAMRRATSTGMAPINASVLETLRLLNPPAAEAEGPIPPIPEDAPTLVCEVDAIRLWFTKAQNGSAPSVYGWTAELIVALFSDPVCANALTLLIQSISNGATTEYEQEILLVGDLLSLLKPGKDIEQLPELLQEYICAEGVASAPLRPVVVGSPFVKAAQSGNMKRVSGAIADALPPPQFGTGFPGGSEAALHRVQTLLDANPGWVSAALDQANAFTRRGRAALLRALFAMDGLKSLWRLAYWCYGGKSTLLVRQFGEVMGTIISERGAKQGDPLAGLLFALSVKDVYESCASGLAQLACVMDDLHIVGPPEDVLRSMTALTTAIAEDDNNGGGLALAPPKSKLLTTAELSAEHRRRFLAFGFLSENIRDDFLPALGAVLFNPHSPTFESNTVPAMQAWAADKILLGSVPLHRLLRSSSLIRTQNVLNMLSSTVVPKPCYLTRTLEPRITQLALVEFDLRNLEVFSQRANLGLNPRAPSPNDPVAISTIHSPYRYGGRGMRELAVESPEAYFSAVVAAADNGALAVPNLAPLSVDRLEAARALILARPGASACTGLRALLPAADTIRVVPVQGAAGQPAHVPVRGAMQISTKQLQRRLGHCRAERTAAQLFSRLLAREGDVATPSGCRVLPSRAHALMASLVSHAQPGARGRPLSLYRSRPEFMLKDRVVEHLVQLSLHLPPPVPGGLSPNRRPPVAVVCICDARVEYRDILRHAHCCPSFRGEQIQRHNSIAQCLARILRCCGAHVIMEPKDLAVPLERQRRPDLTVTFPASCFSPEPALLDVAVTAEFSASNLTGGSTRLALSSAIARGLQGQHVPRRHV
jgi:hypothetical protein